MTEKNKSLFYMLGHFI